MAPRLPATVLLAKRDHDASKAAWRRHKQHCPTCKQAQADELPSNMCSTGYEVFRDEHLTDQAERNARIAATRLPAATGGLW
jgi:hypothetical protein